MTDEDLKRVYWFAHEQFGPFEVGPEEFVAMFRAAEAQGGLRDGE